MTLQKPITFAIHEPNMWAAVYLYLQMNETALSDSSALSSSPWPPSPRSVRHPATLTAVSRYSVRHLDSEVRQKFSKIYGGKFKRRIHIFCRSSAACATVKGSRPTSLGTPCTSSATAARLSGKKMVSRRCSELKSSLDNVYYTAAFLSDFENVWLKY